MAGLAALLADRLSAQRQKAATPRDRAGCENAAHAASLMAEMVPCKVSEDRSLEGPGRRGRRLGCNCEGSVVVEVLQQGSSANLGL